MNFKIAAFADEAEEKISEQIKAMQDNGIKYLEIRGVDGENIADITYDKAKQVKKQLDEEGIFVWSLGSPYGKIGITEDFTPHLDSFKRGVELCSILGAGHMRIFSFYIPEGEQEHYRDEVTERLDSFVCAAKGSGIVLCHENEKGIYGDVACRCADIHKAVPSLRAVFDPANFVQCGQETLEAWEMLSEYVEYMHIKDAAADGTVVPAGHGVGNIPKLLEGYKGSVLTVEPHLSAFCGLGSLEKSEKTKFGFSYPSRRAAFDAAVNSLKEIIL